MNPPHTEGVVRREWHASGLTPTTRVASLIEASGPLLLEKEEWAASAGRLRALAARLDVDPDHSPLQLGYELRHGPDPAVDFSMSAHLRALRISPSVVLPDWWPRLDRILYGPPPGGGEPVFHTAPWLEFDETSDSMVLGGVFLTHLSSDPSWTRIAEDFSALDPAYSRIATSGVLRELTSRLGRGVVGLMCGREGPDARHLKVVGELDDPDAVTAFRNRWVERTGDQSSLGFLERLRRCWLEIGEGLRALASFDVDLDRDALSPRLGFELAWDQLAPSAGSDVVAALPDLVPEVGGAGTQTLVPRLERHVREWPEEGVEMANGERCWMALNHLKITHRPSTPTELKFYLRADTRSLHEMAQETGVAASGLPRRVFPVTSGEPVYALGTLEHDFGTDARADAFARRLGGPAGTHQDPVRMADHLRQNPSDAEELLWLLCIDGAPIYALRPRRAFAAEIYGVLLDLFGAQIEAEIERIGIPALSTAQSVRLRDGEVVPLLELPDVRGVHGWRNDELVEAALSAVGAEEEHRPTVRRDLNSFLSRIQDDLRNRGRAPEERALNFAATNAFQAATVFTEAVRSGLVLDGLEVVHSPLCRPDSDCRDVVLRFFDPETSRRSRRTYRYTIDVSDLLPVTVGEVRSWREPGSRS